MADVEFQQQPTEDDSKYAFQFSDVSIRAAFIKKVFMLVTVMFGIVAIMCAIPFISSGFKDWTSNSTGGMVLFCVSIGIFIVVSLVLICVKSVRRSFPANIILLGIFTLSAGYMTMMTVAMYSVSSVLMCFAITTGSSAAIIIFAATMKKDLTSYIGLAFILGITLFFFGITATIACVAFNVQFLYTVYAALSALLMMFYLAIDVQMIMGGRRYEISPEDYIFAALQIFLDILNIFLFLLQIFGKR